MIPDAAVAAADVYKAGRLAGHLWRLGEHVTFAELDGYDGPAVATTLPRGHPPVTTDRFRLPAYFAGLLPEGQTRRVSLARALHLAEDDELGLLAQIGADTIGDVQVVPAGTPLPTDALGEPVDLTELSFPELLAVPDRLEHRAAVAGVQPKISYHSRTVAGGAAGRVILKLAPDASWHGVLHNEAVFTTAARRVGLAAPDVELVDDRDGVGALAVTRFDRSVADGRLRRHAQEDAAQVLGLQPAEKYDPDARQVVTALAEVCAAPRVARRDLLHQLLYSYTVGNNDVHAKNLSVGRDPHRGLWQVTPVYDVLHTWPYEGDHRFHPAIGARPHDTASRRQWVALAADLGLPGRVVDKLIDAVGDGVGGLVDELDAEQLNMPSSWVRDVHRRIRKRLRDLQ